MRNRYLLALQVTAGLMFAHQIAGKAARDGLFLLNYGPAGLPAMITGAAAFSVLLSLLNGRFLRRTAPRSALPWTLGASGALQLAECWLLRVDPMVASIVIYLHMAGVGAVLLSTFWSMLNEEFDPREAKRQFGRIAAGGTAGGLLGGVAAERAVAWSGAPALMLLLAALHLGCGVFLAVLLRRRPAAAPAPRPTGRSGGRAAQVAAAADARRHRAARLRRRRAARLRLQGPRHRHLGTRQRPVAVLRLLPRRSRPAELPDADRSHPGGAREIRAGQVDQRDAGDSGDRQLSRARRARRSGRRDRARR